MTEPAPAPPKPRRFLRRLLRAASFTLLALFLAITTLWSTLAIAYTHLNGAPPRSILAALFFLAMIAALFFTKPRRYAPLLLLAAFLLVLLGYFSIQPSNTRDWAPDVAQLASVQIDGNKLLFHNIRNFDYHTSDTDYTPHWEDRTYNLDQLQTVDFTLCYWGPTIFAHGIVSFGFSDGRYLAFSIETRKQKTQSFSTVEGFFRQYELIYIVSDERDVLRVRTNFRKENLYLYHTRSTPQEVRAIFLSYLESLNTLHDHPQFYNALTSNCITDIVPHARAGHPSAYIGWQLLLSGYAARQAYQNNNLDTSIPYEELQARSHINPAAEAANDSPDFSTLIRVGLPVPK